MTVLVTGAASGIGRASAAALLGAGHTVIGLDLFMPQSPADGNFRAFAADITSEDALAHVRNTLAEEGVLLDAIVCVAGVHAMVALTESDFSAIRRPIDVNLLGTMLSCRILHSLLAPRGRIVIITSEVAAMPPLPFNGVYTVSKTALDAYAQALRQELSLLSQRVITVRPGAIETPLCEGSLSATATLAAQTTLYKKEAARFLTVTKRFMGRPKPPEAIAATILRAVTAKHPRLTYKKYRNPGLVLLSLLPLSWQCAIVRRLLR